MKKTKTNLLVKLVILAGILYIILLAIQKIEGFVSAPTTPTTTIVDLYFGIDNSNKPVLISSSSPSVTFVSSTVGGVATLNIQNSLGTLKMYNAVEGHKTTQPGNVMRWEPFNSARYLDKGANANSVYLKSAGKILHNPAYTLNLTASSTEAKLPQLVSSIDIYNLNASLFGVIGNGDPTKKDAQGNNAKIRIQLTF